MIVMEYKQDEGNMIVHQNYINSKVFFHGTKTNLNPGDLIEPGYNSNYGTIKI